MGDDFGSEVGPSSTFVQDDAVAGGHGGVSLLQFGIGIESGGATPSPGILPGALTGRDFDAAA